MPERDVNKAQDKIRAALKTEQKDGELANAPESEYSSWSRDTGISIRPSA